MWGAGSLCSLWEIIPRPVDVSKARSNARSVRPRGHPTWGGGRRPATSCFTTPHDAAPAQRQYRIWRSRRGLGRLGQQGTGHREPPECLEKTAPRTVNGQERLNEEVRRRERVIRIFPNRESAIRLLGALMMQRDEHWSTGKRCLDLSAYWQWRKVGHDAQEGCPAVEEMSLPKGQSTETL